ncbi:uncharacterized protein [Euphorbia lathyris]|uniref:uncharacterized protein n=1 Tax=Euphorbia lathyris TaxID=212925 RepID=UPI003313717E
MEVRAGVSHSYEKQSIECLASPDRANNPSEKEVSVNTSLFVNHAAIAWHESRRKWIGDQSQKSESMQKEPIISWSTTYEELLSTNEPFSEPIPLPEMVDFLVDIWHDDGLFD